MRIKSVWKSYERVAVKQSFVKQSIPEKVDEVIGLYSSGKTGSDKYDEKAKNLGTEVNRINIKGAAKSWHKTHYDGEEYFVPSILFFFEAPPIIEEDCNIDSDACHVIPQSLKPIFLLQDYSLITLI